MQRTPAAVLAGGHEEHFNFLPGGELVSKTSRLREVYFYLWICQITGKPVLRTSSEATFLAELFHGRRSAAAALLSSDKASRAADVPPRTAAGPQACICTSRLSLCKPETVDGMVKEAKGDLTDPLEGVPEKDQREDGAFLGKVDLPVCDSGKTEGACHQGQRFYIVGQERYFCGKLSDEHHLTTDPSLSHRRDETFLRNLVIPKTSMQTDDFSKFSTEYHRQARAIAPWLPQCLGAIEHIQASSSLHTTNSSAGTTAAKCVTRSSPSARPKGEIVMENLLYGMCKPAVMDTKLGTRYYGEVVSPAKREKEARYARQRGTQEVGMAFGGYCCRNPFDKNVVSVLGGSRAPENFNHPKTVEAFSYWIQSFLMLQGNLDVAIDLGRTFASLVSGLVDVRRSMQERPLMDFFGTSVLLIYDAAAQRLEHSARTGDLTGAKEQAKGEAMMLYMKEKEGKAMETKEQIAADKSKDAKVDDQGRFDEKNEKLMQCSENVRESEPNFIHHFTTRVNDDKYVGTETTGSSSAHGGTAGQCEETTSHGDDRYHAEVTGVCRSAHTLLNAKVRIVDFAHVVILPRQVDEGFIFGLENLRAALRLATSSLENTKRGQLPATY